MRNSSVRKRNVSANFLAMVAVSAIALPSSASNLCLDLFNGESVPPATRIETMTTVEAYRHLEIDSPERKRWLDEQNAFANSHFKTRASAAWMQKFFTQLWEKPAVIDQYQSQSKQELPMTISLVDQGLGKPVELILNRNGTKKTLFSTFQVKKNGSIGLTSFIVDPIEKHVVVPFSRDGSIDSFELRVIGIELRNQREVLSDASHAEVTWISPDEFVYYRRSGNQSSAFVHKIGTKQTADLLVPDGTFYSSSDTNKFVSKFENGRSFIKRMQDTKWSETDVFASEFLGQNALELFVKSETEDGVREIRALPIQPRKGNLSFGSSRVVFRETPTSRIRSASMGHGKILVHTSWGAKGSLYVLGLDGKPTHEIDLPTHLSLGSFKAVSNEKLDLQFRSAVTKSKVFQFDLSVNNYVGGRSVLDVMMKDADGVEYISTVLTAKSNDGAEVPVRVTHRKDLKLDGDNPAVMEGYGGFGVGGYFRPSFNAIHFELMKRGGVYVAPALRGGDEFGKEWHDQAKFDKKQNVFNDFIASAELVQKLGYTKPARMGIAGWSNGGLLTGTVVTQRPDLFRVVVVGAGVEDMLRKERLDPKFGEGWSYEYGKSDVPAAWGFLRQYSPLLNAKPANYPTILVFTGQNDSRVNPSHSYKLVATLQKAQRGKNPVMMTATRNAGHWLTSQPLQDYIAWRSNIRLWSTVWDAIGLKTEK